MKHWLITLCVGVLMLGLVGLLWFYNAPASKVYACADKKLNPVDVQKQCERLTRGQWWSK